MIRLSYSNKNYYYPAITCTDGNVFSGTIDECYAEAMAYERKLMKQFLSQYVNVVYDIMQDAEENEDGEEYEDLADLLGSAEYAYSRLPIYVLKPKLNADLEYVAEAVKSWYRYLIVELHANRMMGFVPDPDDKDGKVFAKYERIEVKFDHSLRSNNAYAIVAQWDPSSTTIWLTLTTIQDEVYKYNIKIDSLIKEQVKFIDLGERVVDIGIK